MTICLYKSLSVQIIDSYGVAEYGAARATYGLIFISKESDE
jgi:hypothetical protein